MRHAAGVPRSALGEPVRVASVREQEAPTAELHDKVRAVRNAVLCCIRLPVHKSSTCMQRRRRLSYLHQWTLTPGGVTIRSQRTFCRLELSSTGMLIGVDGGAVRLEAAMVSTGRRG